MSNPHVMRHFGQVAGRYAHLRGTWPLGAVRRQEQHAVEALAAVRPGEWVLDVGCGDGETLAWLEGRGARAFGIDCSLAMASACHQRGLRVCVQDMEALGVRRLFDWVLCVGALEFTADPVRALANLAQCLRPDGRFVLLFPRRSALGVVYQVYHRRHGVSVHIFSYPAMRRLLAAVGLACDSPWRDCWLSTVLVAMRVSGGVSN
jgi:SAM-dependent methyltransferase